MIRLDIIRIDVGYGNHAVRLARRSKIPRTEKEGKK